MKTQAAILVTSKQELIVDEIEINNPLQEGQVLVKIEKSGICGAQINEIDAVKVVTHPEFKFLFFQEYV